MKAKQIGWILVGAAVGILVACSGSSSADTGLTQSQVQTMITAAVSPLESEITTLQTQVQTLQASSVASQAQIFIKAPNASATIAASIRQTRALRGEMIANGISDAALPSPCNWTLTGRPTTSEPVVDNIYSGVSCTGYYFDVSGATASQDGAIQQINNHLYVIWTGPNCTGTPYVANGVSPGAQVNGFVFIISPTPGFIGADPDAADYWYVPANSAYQNITGESVYTQDNCSNAALTWPALPMLPNDPSVTGIPSAPIPGPVLISN